MTKKRGRSPAKRLLLTDRSLSDLAAIEKYSIEQWGKRTASRYVAEIEGALARVQGNPELLRQEVGFHPCLRFYNVKQHVLVFDMQVQEIILLTVFHGSMDIPSRLAELEPTLAAEVELLHDQLRRK